MSVLVTLAVLALLFFWIAARYNRLMALRNQVTKRWRDLEVQLKRRRDLMLDFINTEPDGEFDKSALEALIAARHRATIAAGPADAARKEEELAQAISAFLATAASTPTLTADQQVRALREGLRGVDGTIGSARRSYNDIAVKYNAAIHVVPGNVIAGLASFRRAEMFD